MTVIVKKGIVMIDVVDNFFCHCCEDTVSVELIESTEEYICNICRSPFVEAPDQNVEEFMIYNTTIPSPTSSPTSSSTSSSSLSATLLNNSNNDNDNDNDNEDYVSELSSIGPTVRSLLRRMVGLDRLGLAPRELGLALQSAFQENGTPVNVLLRSSGANHIAYMDLLSTLSNGGNVSNMLNNDYDSENLDEVLHSILMNETSHATSPADPETISSLKRRKLLEDDTCNLTELGECGITHEEFENGDTIITLNCGHVYKEDAIVQWLAIGNTCPTCRQVVIIEN